MRRRVAAFLLIVCLLAGGVTASAAGSASDPLVSKTYADDWAEAIVKAAAQDVDAAVSGAFSGTKKLSLTAGSGVKLSVGSSVVLLSGTAMARVVSGSLLNVSTGTEVSSGSIGRDQMYICCEKSSVTVTATSGATLLVSGSYTSVANTNISFADVPSGSWYYDYVYSAVAMGLVDGITDTSYGPDKTFTVAQAIKIAACMHQLYHEGSVSLTNGEPWYASYVSYAVNNGIAPESYGSLTSAQYNSPISRRDYVMLFYNALPSSEYQAINSVADNSIPDVASGSIGSTEIYTFYRAGILDGSRDDGSFLPDSSIKRSEVAAIIVRMFDIGERKTLTLG